jgi:hypothetical protein
MPSIINYWISIIIILLISIAITSTTTAAESTLTLRHEKVPGEEHVSNTDNNNNFQHHSQKACWRGAKSRGTPTLPDRETHTCPKSAPNNEGGICYPDCPQDYEPLAGICWESCKGTLPSTGLFFCCRDEQTCTELLDDLGFDLPEAIVKLALDLANNPTNFDKIFNDYKTLLSSVMKLVLPSCDGDFSGQQQQQPNRIIELAEF